MGVFEYAVLAQDYRVIVDLADGAARVRFILLRHPFKKAVTPLHFDGTTLLGGAIKGCIWGHRRVKYPLAGPRVGPQGPSIDAGKGLAYHDCQATIAGSDAAGKGRSDRPRWFAGRGFRLVL